MWHKDWSQRKTIVLFGWGIINNDRMENLGYNRKKNFDGKVNWWKKKFCLAEKKNAMMIENVVCINLFSLKKLIV